MQLRNDELAERILEAAKSEFLEKGYRQASVRSIAASVAGSTAGGAEVADIICQKRECLGAFCSFGREKM